MYELSGPLLEACRALPDPRQSRGGVEPQRRRLRSQGRRLDEGISRRNPVTTLSSLDPTLIAREQSGAFVRLVCRRVDRLFGRWDR